MTPGLPRVRYRRPMASETGCDCICHIPGSRVEVEPGQVCCWDMDTTPHRGKVIPPDPSARPARISACSPEVYLGRSGVVEG